MVLNFEVDVEWKTYVIQMKIVCRQFQISTDFNIIFSMGMIFSTIALVQFCHVVVLVAAAAAGMAVVAM